MDWKAMCVAELFALFLFTSSTVESSINVTLGLSKDLCCFVFFVALLSSSLLLQRRRILRWQHFSFVRQQCCNRRIPKHLPFVSKGLFVYSRIEMISWSYCSWKFSTRVLCIKIYSIQQLFFLVLSITDCHFASFLRFLKRLFSIWHVSYHPGSMLLDFWLVLFCFSSKGGGGCSDVTYLIIRYSK